MADRRADHDAQLYRYPIPGGNKPSHQQSGSGHSNSLDRKVFSSSDDAEEASDGGYVVVTGFGTKPDGRRFA